MAKLIEKLVGTLDDKRRWRHYKERVKALPANHRTAIEAVERYLMYFGAISDGGVLVSMLEDLADLFEQNAADRIGVREVVGEDPVEFAEIFLANYTEGQWINAERQRLIEAIERAEQVEEGVDRDDHRA